ncbi:hypothetical protein BD560DRAFT_409817 [Blakeslea trispora]|nr:hypothetical protein BD560DRAFT_409817 [Blakeslea trispora]
MFCVSLVWRGHFSNALCVWLALTSFKNEAKEIITTPALLILGFELQAFWKYRYHCIFNQVFLSHQALVQFFSDSHRFELG